MVKTYRLIAREVRLQRGAGRPDLNVQRPHRIAPNGRTIWLDEQQPTLIDVDEHCRSGDVERLLRIGALEVWQEP